MKKIAAMSLVAGIAVALATTPVHAASPRQIVITDPQLLSIGVNAFPPAPTGALTIKVDRAAADIDADTPLVMGQDGKLFRSLGSYGTLYESIDVPAGAGDTHMVTMFASAFPSSKAAQQAFSADVSNINQLCDAVFNLTDMMHSASCSWVDGSDNPANSDLKNGTGAASDVVSVIGTVEYVTESWIGKKDRLTVAQLNPTKIATVGEATSIARSETLHLQHLLSPNSTPTQPIAPAKAHPAPVVKPRPVPITKPAHAASPAFTVAAWVTPSSMSYNAYPTLYVKSVPGASCSASVTYSTGRSPVSFDGSPQTLSANGTASWSWHEETVGSGGTATVDCTYHGQDHTADASFTVQ